MKLTFLGATGTVTGSKYLIESKGENILVDCGLFQGFKQLRLRNWERLPFVPADIDTVVLTHAHIDHSGYLPLLVRNGFRGRVICTPGTHALCNILLPDSGYLQEQDADFANRHGYSKHTPALPLYTEEDARIALQRFDSIDYGIKRNLGGHMTLSFRNAGHIVGAAIAILSDGHTTLTFSGDLGRANDPIMCAPAHIARTDYLILESTYGDRVHDPRDPEDLLAEIVTKTAARGGTVIVPAFAVGRAQMLLYYLQRLKKDGRIPELPIFLDSPMAIDASDILWAHHKDHRLNERECRALHGSAREVRSAEKSRTLDRNMVPSIIVSASGMATGGRVLHHLKTFGPDPRNAIVLAGFQAAGTRGASLLAGVSQVKIHGEFVPIRAEIFNLDMLSAHADSNEIMDWLRAFESPPRETFITHGEPAASDALRQRIERELGWQCRVPAYRDDVELI